MEIQATRTTASEEAIREILDITSAQGLSSEGRLRALLAMGCRRFNLPIGMLTQVKGESLELAFGHLLNTDFAEGARFSLEESFCSLTLRAEGPIAFEHAGASEWANHPAYQALKLEAYLGTKVTTHGQVFGTLCFTGPIPYRGQFTAADKDFLQLIARWVGSEIERRHAEAALVDRTRLLNLDAEVGRVITEGEELRVLLQGCTDALVKHLDAALARIWTLNSKEQILELQASSGMYTHLRGRHSRVPVGEFKVGSIAADKKPHLTNAVIGDPRVHDQEWAKREGLVAFAGYPLLRNGEVIGVMALFARHPLTEFTLQGLRSVADRITVALERHTATDALRKLARHHELILASAGEGIYGLDPEGRITFANPAAVAMLGYDAEGLFGLSMHATIHHAKPDGSIYPKRDCPIHAALSDGVVHHGDTEVFWRKDGTSFPVEYTSTPIWEEGRLVGAVVTFRDITARRQAQDALARSEDLLRSVINNTTAVIYVKWVDGRYLMINSRYEQLFNVTQEQMRGKTDYDIFPKEIADAFRENDFKVLHTRGSVESEEYAPHADGLHAYISIKFPLFDENGVPYATCGISSDITELKRAQDDLHKSEARRMEALQQSDVLKSALLSSVSHEFRTPLTSIKNVLSHVIGKEGRTIEGRDKELLLAANWDLDYLTVCVDNLLTMSRIEAGDVGHNRQWHLLEDLLEASLRRLKAGGKAPDIRLDFRDTLPPLLVDGIQIQQVLINLLDNAIKYSQVDSLIRVGTRVDDKEIAVRITNVGEGIPLQDLPRVFDRFYRVKREGGKPTRGTGLGLAICRAFVESHGGRIWAESTPGGETTLTFTLPLKGSPSHAFDFTPDVS